ncbi:MAG: S-layer homology domain-containing protein [Oscillospiraceae bacterium]|nr:S-layer homology domain-containing protein [Oscillospiraceae bacterium]
MKRTVIWLLVLSMLLGMMPGIPLTASAATADDPNYRRFISIRWGENGEYYWDAGYDHEQKTEYINDADGLPEGVTYETGHLTLSGASLFSICIEGWGTIPFHLEVLGENTVAAKGDDIMALAISYCHDVTVDGGGSLTLTGENLVFQNNDTVAGTFSQENGEVNYENGLLTLRNVTLTTRNVRSHEDFSETDGWRWAALNLNGNTLLQDMTLTVDGHGGMNVSGNLTVDGCSVDSTGLQLGFRDAIANDDDISDGIYPATARITDSTVAFRDYGVNADWIYHTVVMQPAATLTIGEGADVTIDHTYHNERLSALVINSDWYGAGSPGHLRMEGGRLTIRSDDAAHSAVFLHDQATWTQTGGEVIIETSQYNNACVTVGRGATWLQTGGSLSISNTEELVSTEDGFHAAALEFYQGGRGIFSGGTLTASGDLIQAIRINGDVIFSGTELNLDAYDTGLDLYDRANVKFMGGHMDFTAQNPDNGFGVMSGNGAGFTMTGGSMDLNAVFGFYSYGGRYRFLGGESRITGRFAACGGQELYTFGDGIRIAYDDGTEALWQDEWAVDLHGSATIKSQTVSAPECVLMPEFVRPNSIVMGVPAPVELLVSLTSPSGTVHVDLPLGAKLDDSGVWVNGRQTDYTETEEGFSLTAANGSYITFQLVHTISGEQTLTARAENREFPLTYTCSGYSFTVNPVTLTSDIIMEGVSLPGSTVEIHEANNGFTIPVKANELGTWRCTLRLPEIGEYFFYAMIYDADGNYLTVSSVERVRYSATETVLSTLTVGNWVHGPTDESPHEYREVVFDFVQLESSDPYYTYWPELPEFTFTARFAGNSGSPANIKEVMVVAIDDRDISKSVPLTYDEETKCWTGKADFCCYGSIVPNRFQVTWKYPDGSVGSGQEEYVDPREEINDDETSGAMVILPADLAGPYELDLSSSAKVKSVTNGLGEQIEWNDSYSHDKNRTVCNFTLEPGEFYTVELERGGFKEWPKEKELTIFVSPGEPIRTVEYQDGVQPVDSSTLTDWTDTSFESTIPYSVGDVLLIDDANAVTVTGVENGIYTYTAAGIDEVYRHLELSGLTGTEEVTVTFGETEAELEARFRESDLYQTYLQALSDTVAELQGTKEFEGKIAEDTTFKVSLNYDIDGSKAILKPEISLSTTMKTKLPNKAEEETKIEMVLSVEVVEDLDFHIRSLNDDRNIQSYLMISDETITTSLSITASIGEEDGSSSKSFDGYFADKLRSNFLEKLKKEPSKTPFELLKDARISAMVYPGIFLYARPSVEVEWNFFGEVYLKGTMVEKARKGVSLIHLGDRFLGSWDDWSIRKFSDDAAQDRSFSASTGFHMSAFVYPALRIGVGLSVLKVLDLEVWAKAGVKVDFDGHGEITFETKKPVDVEAELLVEVSLESSAGIGGFINIGKNRLPLEFAQFKLWEKSKPIKQFGFGLMPTQFAAVEEEPVGVSSKCDLKRLIDLRLDCQNFKSVGGLAEEPKVLDLDRYTFLLVSGDNVTVDSDGQLTVHDTTKRTEFEVKVIYTGFAKNYRLWKIVPMVYLPANITLTKETPNGPATCVVKVIDITEKPYVSRTVTVPGEIVIPALNGHTYHIIEITPPANHTLDEGVRTVSFGTPEDPSPNPEGRASFYNVPIKDPPTPEPFPIDPIGDPSGFVFEGIESNRLESVTATLYRADDGQGTNAHIWDAEPYDQHNPLTTDSEGKYMWMVPNGWWQVHYALEGYQSAQSEWMIVPPVRTEVNQNLVTDLPAELSMHFSEQSGCPILTFTRPVQVSTVTDYVVRLDGTEVWAYAEPVDADWSVTADPLDSVICATTFRLRLDSDDLREKTVSICIPNVRTYFGTEMQELTGSLTIPALPSHSVTVTGGTGSGTYDVGDEVTVTAQPQTCQIFEYWSSGNTRLEDPWSSITTFRMPDAEVSITANYRWEHSYSSTVTAPTCTEPGYTTHTCTACGDSFTDSYMELAEHSFGEWVLTVSPTYLQTGMETRTCTHCALEEYRLTDPLGNPFSDVPEGSFYYDPVLWAVEGGITNGTSPTAFGPGLQCMRAQVVTFLWRAAGSPEPASAHNPFADVKETDFYYQAVLWAVENGVTNGLDATHFGPFAYCNRAQVVTFLHRSLGSPAVEDSENPFEDVPEGQWFTDPVLWAVEEGITNGLTATAFGPTDLCNRAQIVTFLYRTFA